MRNSARIFQRTFNVAVLVLPVALSSACGGSASETPPPLEPDPHALRPRAAGAPSSRPTFEPRDEAEELTTPRAPSTWGAGARRRAVDAGY